MKMACVKSLHKNDRQTEPLVTIEMPVAIYWRHFTQAEKHILHKIRYTTY